MLSGTSIDARDYIFPLPILYQGPSRKRETFPLCDILKLLRLVFVIVIYLPDDRREDSHVAISINEKALTNLIRVRVHKIIFFLPGIRSRK